MIQFKSNYANNSNDSNILINKNRLLVKNDNNPGIDANPENKVLLLEMKIITRIYSER